MTDAPQMEPACLGVPGAMLYYKTQGHGPPLLMLTHDAPSVRLYRLDLPSLRTTAHRIVPAAGESTKTFPRHCAEALARELGRPLAEFPGGHTGPLLRPRAFATRLRQVLREDMSSVDYRSDSPTDRAKGIEQ
jgi:hypothetical protein